MKKFYIKSLFIIGFFFCITSTIYAQTTIAGWAFDTISASAKFGPSPFAADNSNANVSIGGLTRVGLGTSGTAAAKAWGGSYVSAASANAASFSITANSGYKISLTQIGAYNVRRSNAGPTTGQWQYQIGSNGFVNIGSAITWGSVTSGAGNPQSAIDLSGISDLQNVAAGTTITFQVLLTGGTNGGTFYLNDLGAGDDFTILGTVATAAPVTLDSFYATKTMQGALLKWSTKTEINSGSYEIYKSLDAKSFSKIGTVASQNNINGADYSYTDATYTSDVAYYQLKMIDLDGKFKYSPTISIGGGSSNNNYVSIVNTLVQDNIYLKTTNSIGSFNARIIDASGKIILTKSVSSNSPQISATGLQRGVYFLQLTGSGLNKTERFIKQ